MNPLVFTRPNFGTGRDVRTRDAKIGEAGYMTMRSAGDVRADFDSCANRRLEVDLRPNHESLGVRICGAPVQIGVDEVEHHSHVGVPVPV